MSRPARSELVAKRVVYAPVFAALGDPTRLSLVAKLCGGPPCSISKLTQDTKLTRQAVTKHLRVLERARLVQNTRAGRERHFAFNPEPIEAIKQYLDLVSAQWDDALARLRTFVEG
jgi:DNA-binding transcriptional ArsR family regulator